MNANSKKRRTSGSGVVLGERAVTPKLTDHVKPYTRLSGSSAANGSQSPRGDDRFFSHGDSGVMKSSTPTPGRNVVNPNITPRSGSRRARAEAPSPNNLRHTPGGTPTTSRPQSSSEKRDRFAAEVKSPNTFVAWSPASGRTSRSESLLSDGNGSSLPPVPPVLERNNSSYSSNGITSPKGPSMFFHANDVQATISSKQPSEKATAQSRLQGWVNTIEGSASERTPPTLDSSLPEEPISKFFYANDHAPSKSPPPRLPNGASSNRPPLQTIYSAHGATSPQRAPSPLKEEITPPRRSSISQASPRRHTRLISNGGSEIKAPEAVKTDLSRRSSLNSRTEARTSTSRVRSPSVHSTGGTPSGRNSTNQPNTSPTGIAKRLSMSGIHGALPLNVKPPTSAFSFSQDQNGPLSPSLSQSPTVPQSKIEQMNELAAKARRERKVLDLEISNSSLLAINRTLEREMRKQTSELRHYRRLSRSGRLSVLPTSRSGRKSKLSDGGNGIDSDDVTSSTDSDDSDDDGDDTRSTKSSASNASNSPTTRAARARFQDPERPPLDLSAHRSLLLESQKINQAIKRCLSHTDAMIAAGKQALEAHTHKLEPESLGPRVLTPDEDDEAVERGQGLLSPSLAPGNMAINPWEQSLAQVGSLDGNADSPSSPDWAAIGDNPPAFPNHTPYKPDEPTEIPPSADDSADSPPSSPPVLPSTPKPAIRPTPSSTPHNHDPDNDNDNDHSFQASLDGLTPSPSPPPNPSSPTPSTPTPPAAAAAPHQLNNPPTLPSPTKTNREESPTRRPASPTRPPPTTNAAANVPGNRSSIQNLGTYFGFQNLGIFGQGGGGGG